MTQVSISIDVPSLEQGEKFYCKALGCSKLREEGNMCVLSAGNVEIYLLKREPGSQPLPNLESTRSFERHWTPVHFDFGVNDVKESVDLIRRFGGEIEGWHWLQI